MFMNNPSSLEIGGRVYFERFLDDKKKDILLMHEMVITILKLKNIQILMIADLMKRVKNL